MNNTNRYELLILEPRDNSEKTQAWFRSMLTTLLLEGVDFEFDSQGRVPVALPDELSRYDNVLILREDLDVYRKQLEAHFPQIDAYLQDPYPYAFAESHDRRTRLFVAPLERCRNPRVWGSKFWASRVTPQSPRFAARQMGRSDDEVFEQQFASLLASWQHYLDTGTVRPDSYIVGILGEPIFPWGETGASYNTLLFDLSDLTGRPEFAEIARASLGRHVEQNDADTPPMTGDQWAFVEPIARWYEESRDPQLLSFIKKRLQQRKEHWPLWNGMYTLWPRDRWIRDSNMATMVPPGVKAAPLLDDAEAANEIFEQAVHQAITTEQLMRDPDTGLYHFGSDGERHCPSLLGHGSAWQAYALVQILRYLPTRHVGYEKVADVFRRLAEALKRWQRSDGLWSLHVDLPNHSTGDVHYTGEFVGALYRGLTLGVLDVERFEPIARRGLDGIKLRSFRGCVAGGACGTGLTSSPLYFSECLAHNNLHSECWQQLFPVVEYLRWQKACDDRAATTLAGAGVDSADRMPS